MFCVEICVYSKNSWGVSVLPNDIVVTDFNFFIVLKIRFINILIIYWSDKNDGQELLYYTECLTILAYFTVNNVQINS